MSCNIRFEFYRCRRSGLRAVSWVVPTLVVTGIPVYATADLNRGPDVMAPAQPTSGERGPTATPTDDLTADDDQGGLLGPIRLGPMVGVGLPSLLNIGGLLKITPYFGVGVNFGLIPKVRLSYYGDATLTYREYDAFARIFPFGGGFFLGTGAGYATVSGTMTNTFDTTPYASLVPASLSIPKSLTYSSEGSVETMVLTPQIGYFYTTKVGFSIGIDVGAQIPIAPSKINYQSRLPLPAGTPQQLVDDVKTRLLDPTDQNVKDTLQTVGRAPLPTFNLRIGWLL